MPKAYDVFLQKPSDVLSENVEIIGMFFSSNQRILKSESARNFRKTPIYEISNQKEPIFFSGKSALVLRMLHVLLVPRMPAVRRKTEGSSA